jgi:hypothetical protein
MAKLDGSDARRITAEGEKATLAGIAPHPGTRDEAIYFVSLDGSTGRTIWAVDLATSERMKLFSFESRSEGQADASISSSGRYVAYSHGGGIDMVDLYTGVRRHLFDNGPVDCDAGSCFAHSVPQWSPDETQLAARKTFWEGGTTVVLDPFADQLIPMTNDSSDGPWAAYWSPGSDSICGHGSYGEGDLHFAEAPSWIFSKAADDPGIVARCSWIDGQTVAYTVNVLRPDANGDVVPEGFVDVFVLNRNTGQPRLVTEYDEGISIVSAGLLALPGSMSVLTQNSITEPGQFEDYISQPHILDISTGARTPALLEGDWVVAVLAP